MLKTLLAKLFPLTEVYAHCDIPCGIYDPHAAQVAAFTIIRMTGLLTETKDEDPKTIAFKIARYTRVKDEHAQILKREIRVIWGDYFKEENLETFPNLHDLVFKIMHLASKSAQEVNPQVASELLEKVQDFAEIFYQSKGLAIQRIKAAFPTAGEIVVNK